MPALFRAFKLQKRAAKTGFDWSDIVDVWKKLDEELEELRQARAQMKNSDTTQRVEEELGDVLFTVVNLSRFLAINPRTGIKTGQRSLCRAIPSHGTGGGYIGKRHEKHEPG